MAYSSNRFLTGIAAAIALIALGSCTASEQAKNTETLRIDFSSFVREPADYSHDVQSRTLAGNYLAGRFAQHAQDWNTAKSFMARAQAFDPANQTLMLRTFLLALGAGDMEQTRSLAADILQSHEGDEADLARIFLVTDALAGGDHAGALGHLSSLPDEGFGFYTKPLLSAWAHAAQGDREKALGALKGWQENPVYALHAGLVEVYFQSDPDAVRDYFVSALENGITLRSALLVSSYFAQNGHKELAEEIHLSLKGQGQDGQEPKPLSAVSGQSLEILHQMQQPGDGRVASAAEGAAIAMFDFAAMLFEKDALDSALIYCRLAQRLAPDSPYVQVMLGDIMVAYGRYDEAVSRYSKVASESGLAWVSRLRAADTLERSGRMREAIGILSHLADNDPRARADALMQLGDLYRRGNRFPDAIAAYTRAIDALPALESQHWPLVYARGVAHERVNDWDSAEKDLLAALELQPDNPLILNYLGYSWAEQGVRLPEALDMIRRAALMRPTDGYIIDSYGWVLYKMGHYNEATELLEQAVALVPNDAGINAHLGDAYWQVDRKTEARYQWQRAIHLATDPGMKRELQARLQTGLPDAASPGGGTLRAASAQPVESTSPPPATIAGH